MPPKVNSRVRKQDEFQTVQEAKRTSKCRAQMSLPSSDAGKLVIFKCNTAHPPDDPVHTESGRVKLRNGKLFCYDISWNEEDRPEVWREEQEPKLGFSDPPLRVQDFYKYDVEPLQLGSSEPSTEEHTTNANADTNERG